MRPATSSGWAKPIGVVILKKSLRDAPGVAAGIVEALQPTA